MVKKRTLEVKMIRGYPASGKSTLSEGYGSYVRLNRDDEGGKVSSLVPKMAEALESGNNVLLDNTFPDAASRAPFIRGAKEKGARISCTTMSTSIEDAQFNACKRIIRKYGGMLGPDELRSSKDPAVLPPAALFAYRKKADKPTLAEGFFSVDEHEFVRERDPRFDQKAVIVDFDDTIRAVPEGAPHRFPTKLSEVRILPRRREVLQKYLKDGYRILGVSNQSGINKGDVTKEMAEKCFERTLKKLKVDVEYIYCPHGPVPIRCWCRKPMPGVGVFFIEYFHLDPSRCVMVGDQTTDKTFAGRCGFQYSDQKDFFA